MEDMSARPASSPSDPPELRLAGPEVLAEIVALEQERARLDARSARLLARMDADRLYQLDGAATARSWLKAHTAMASGTAAARLKTARQLRDLPVISDHLAAGRLSADQVRTLLRGLRPSTSTAFAADQDTLVAAAASVHIDDLPRVVRVWLAHTDPDGTDPHDGLMDQEVHLNQVLDGAFALTGSIEARGGQELARATGNLLRTYASARFPTATLRNSVMARDRRCRFHGCDRPASVCDVHHVIHDAHGGRTEPGNLVLLCGRHHALLHRGWSARMTADGRLEIRRPCGTVLTATPRWDPPDTG
jgi:hypothetical protein